MKTKILIVDDEPLNLTTLEAFLAGEGYDLIFASNGFDACAKAQVERPDLVLLDVMMPEMDGFTVTRRIRSDPEIGRVPIMLITALDDDHSRLEGLRAGADDFLTKPCRRDEIRARVRTVASLNRFRTIAEQRERFEHLFELSPAAIVVVDAQGRVVAANAKADLHRSGDPVFAAFDAATAGTIRELVAETIQRSNATMREVRLGAAEAQRIFHVRGTAIPNGATRQAMLVFDDVTAEVKAREAIEQMNAELEVQVRARTRELEEANALLLSYASFVSHDLRSPLTVVKGYLSMIHEGVVPLDAEAAPLIDTAYNGTLMMQELIQNILQLAQDEHDRPRGNVAVDVDPTPYIRRLGQRMREIYPKSKAVIQVAKLPSVGVSGVLVERVFYNLLTNALKYSEGRDLPRVEIGALESAEFPTIFVRDNGVGFDARDQDKLFREFTRLSTSTGTDGFGLGLSLVARLVRNHGGKIWAESKVGEGATFFVQLPPPMPAAAEARSEAEAANVA